MRPCARLRIVHKTDQNRLPVRRLSAQAVADIIRTTLGPRSMLKMILDPMGGIVMTNDGCVYVFMACLY